jgi:hypothetical protein
VVARISSPFITVVLSFPFRLFRLILGVCASITFASEFIPVFIVLIVSGALIITNQGSVCSVRVRLYSIAEQYLTIYYEEDI